MRIRKSVWGVLAGGLAGLLGLCVRGADEAPKPAEPGTLVVIDGAGKEQKLKAWKFSAGTRRLSWLAPAPREAEPPAKEDEEASPRRKDRPKAPAGPEALVFRPELEIKYVDGVVVLIPLDRLRSLEYDNEKETVTARVATGAKEDGDEVLTGATKYRKINKLDIEAEVDKGELGIAEVKFLGGVPKGIRGIRFPAPKVGPAAPAGRPAVVTADEGNKKGTHKVSDLQPLYSLAGGEVLSPTLMFRKTLKLDVGKVKKITSATGDRDETAWQVLMKDGEDQTLTLLQTVMLEGKRAHLEGLVGRVPAGYKLFPISTVVEVEFDAADEKPEKTPDKEKPDKEKPEKPADKDK